MLLYIPDFLLGSWLTSHFSPKRWVKDFDLYSLCQTRSEEKSNKPCVLQAITVKYLILVEETGKQREQNKSLSPDSFRNWMPSSKVFFKLPKYWFISQPSQFPILSEQGLQELSVLSFCTVVSNPTKFTEAPSSNVLSQLSHGLQKWGENKSFYWVQMCYFSGYLNFVHYCFVKNNQQKNLSQEYIPRSVVKPSQINFITSLLILLKIILRLRESHHSGNWGDPMRSIRFFF